jgi:hypothetical protein
MEHLSVFITVISYAVIAAAVFKIGMKVISKTNFIKEGDRKELSLSLSVVWPMTLCFVSVYFIYLGTSKIMARYKKREVQ